jgi:pimeloyl-ACP methyl ester carboxylesterase
MRPVAAVAAALETSQALLPSGVRLTYVHGGPIDRPAIIMLHGLSDSSFSFSRVQPLLARDFRVIALDQRGHGDSDRPERGYTMDEFATDVIQLMDARGLAAATIVGHSMGSFVARRVAERAPHRVTRLVLIGSGLSPRNPTMAELVTAIDALVDPVNVDFVREFQLSCVNQPVPADFMERVIAESRKVPARVWKAAIAGMWSYRAQWPITVPTLVIGGEKDAVFSRAEQTALFQAIERSALHLEPDTGHTIHWEAPERFVALAFPAPRQDTLRVDRTRMSA